MLAQNLDAIEGNAGINLPFNDVGGLIGNILPYVFGAAGIALLVYLILGGEISQASNIVVSETEGKIILLTGDKLYEVKISHIEK